MHPDMVKLLDLQAKDLALSEVDQRLQQVRDEVAVLDQAVQQARDGISAAQRAAQEAGRRRDEVEVKVDTFRTLQERRRQRLEVTRPGKEAANLMAELDLARSVLAREESEWARAGDQVISLEAKVGEAEARLTALEEEQQAARAALAERAAELEAERAARLAERQASGAGVEKSLLLRYERLRQTRTNEVVVALHGETCGACFTTVPMHRRSKIRTGALVDGCEACGVLLYGADVED